MNIRAFTLLELMIAMTVVFLVSVSLYAPYNYYQNKAQLKLGAKQIEQFLSQARNNAVYGSASGSNLSFGLYIDTDENTQVSLRSYPFDVSLADVNRAPESLEILSLEPGVRIDSVAGNDNALLFFRSVSGDVTVYSWIEDGGKNRIDDDVIEIELSYKGSTSSHLQQTLTYYTKTYVTDY